MSMGPMLMNLEIFNDVVPLSFFGHEVMNLSKGRRQSGTQFEQCDARMRMRSDTNVRVQGQSTVPHLLSNLALVVPVGTCCKTSAWKAAQRKHLRGLNPVPTTLSKSPQRRQEEARELLG